MKNPTHSQRLILLFLCVTLLLGMGIGYYRKDNPPLSLRVIASSEIQEHEHAFEASKKISLTQGTAEDFARLPHVGPELAKRMVAYRDAHGFYKKEDVMQVKGIGAKTYEAIEEFLILE